MMGQGVGVLGVGGTVRVQSGDPWGVRMELGARVGRDCGWR